MAKNLNLNLDLKNLDVKQLIGSLKNVNLTSVKKYSSLFPSIGLLVVAGVILILTLLMGGSVAKKMEQSVRASNDIRSKISQTPSEAEVAEAQRYYQKCVEDVSRVDAMAIKTSLRELICYNPVIFPEPVDKSTQIYDRFGSQYRDAIVKLMERIGAKDAPSEAEIRSRTGQGNPVGEGGMYAMRTTTTGPQNAMVDAFCLQRAEEIPVYANPESFHWYKFWEKYTYKSKEQALTDCWNSQVACWIYEDVIRTIEVFDKGSKKVSTSPVKRLLGVSFSGPVQVMSSTMAGGLGGMGMEMGMGMGTPGLEGTQVQDIPTYVKGYSVFMPVPWTGRMSNDEIDVIHFAVSVVVDSKSVTAFMKELCSAKPHTFREKFEQNGKEESAVHNQITILQYHHQPIVRDNPVHAYYRYGKDAAVQVDLVCEYIFNRKAYDVIKPAPIKALSGPPAAGQPAAGQPAASQPAATGF
jgi:hypothetical protein